MQVMSPFTPFFCETLYLNLRRALPAGSPESVHFCDIPEASTIALFSCTAVSAAVLSRAPPPSPLHTHTNTHLPLILTSRSHSCPAPRHRALCPAA